MKKNISTYQIGSKGDLPYGFGLPVPTWSDLSEDDRLSALTFNEFVGFDNADEILAHTKDMAKPDIYWYIRSLATEKPLGEEYLFSGTELRPRTHWIFIPADNRVGVQYALFAAQAR